MQNGFFESFNGRPRDECLNETLFASLGHARDVLSACKEDYNTVRPHSRRGGRTPSEVADLLAIQSTASHQLTLGLYQ